MNNKLSREEEYALFVLYKERGNQKAKKELITKNMRYVWSIAWKYKNNPQLIPVKDLANEGAMGLIHAIETFDYKRGFRVLTYASNWVRSFINKTLKEKGSLIHLPSNKIEEIKKAKKNTIGNLSSEIKQLINISDKGIPFDSKLSTSGKSGSNLTYADIIPDKTNLTPDNSLDEKRLQDITGNLLNSLDVMERDIVELLMGIGTQKPCTIKNVSKMYGISLARVKQYRNQALRKMKNSADSNELKEKYKILEEL